MRPTLPHTPQPNGLEHFGLQFVLVECTIEILPGEWVDSQVE